MPLPTFVTVNGFQYRGTTAFARGWVDADGDPIEVEADASFAGSLVDLLLDALTDASADRDITADSDTTRLEAAFAVLAREPLANIPALAAPAGTFADLAAATTYATNLNAKVTAILAALVAKGYMAAP
jgi:hypothetical protein